MPSNDFLFLSLKWRVTFFLDNVAFGMHAKAECEIIFNKAMNNEEILSGLSFACLQDHK